MVSGEAKKREREVIRKVCCRAALGPTEIFQTFFRGPHAPRVLLAAPRRKLAPTACNPLSCLRPPNPPAGRRREHAPAPPERLRRREGARARALSMNRLVATPVKAWERFAKPASPAGSPVFARYDGAGAGNYGSWSRCALEGLGGSL